MRAGRAVWVGATALLAFACNPLNDPPPALSPAFPTALLGCEEPRAAHCPPPPCANVPVPGLAQLPFGCSPVAGNGAVDAAGDDIRNVYESFHSALRFYGAVSESLPGGLSEDQREFGSDAASVKAGE